MSGILPLYNGDDALLATMHAKERVIEPLARRFLGLRLTVAANIDTDAFGTFSRDVARAGSQLDAARAKIEAAFAIDPTIDVALASEGSFGPHPYLPFCPLEREIVVLHDRRTGLELIGHHATPDTNFAHAVVSDIDAGLAFAERAGFPAHGVIVLGARDGQPAPDLALVKSAESRGELATAITETLAKGGTAFIETDMRAHRNPRRMRAIRRAMIDLIRKARSPCPDCRQPGFAITERLSGLPCKWCAAPTLLTRADVWTCSSCGLRREQPIAAIKADPGHCPECNP
ncbi:DUF6671 family protein [Sphingomonas sp. 1P08PE]|jgi:hypothetical protein|uniref:DUF6671 family protein n=1 Tax=Sphingomonas sp. 1P08PE TaxID=554122 RepID=UPI0039A3AF69